MSGNDIRNVAIVGASGNIGTFITNELLKTGQHTITAISRHDSKSVFPPAVVVKRVDYERVETLVEALRGQDALVITLSGMAPYEKIEEALVRAAADANVAWIMPNEWSPDTNNEGLVRDVFLFGKKVATRKLIEKLGKSNYIALSTGFWYEYSLAIPKNYGFNFAERKVQFYDDGETRISTSTWPQIGRAVASILSGPVKANGDNQRVSLDAMKNQVVYINSFAVSQRDMLASAMRVTGTKESDWTITHKTSREMYDQGMKDLAEHNWNGPGNFLYGRVFFQDGSGDPASHKGTLNDALGLPKGDIDEATRIAIDRQEKASAHSH